MYKESLIDLNNELRYYKKKNFNTLVLYHGGELMEPYEWMIPFGLFMQKNNFYVVIVISYDKKIDTSIPVYKLNTDEIKLIENLDLLIQNDYYATNYPTNSKIMAIRHGAEFGVECTFMSQIDKQLSFDAYVTSIPLKNSHFLMKQLWENFFDPKFYKRTSNQVYIFSCGYLRSYVISKKIKELDLEPHSICYAPVARYFACQQGGDRIKLYAEKILRVLLEKFPNYKIIFRPPITYSKMDDEIFKIVEKFDKFDNFYFDDTTDRFDCFSQTSVMITDFSHIGNSFSISTYRPTLFFHPWNKDQLPYSCPIGAYCFSYSQLVKYINTCLSNMESIKKNIYHSLLELTIPCNNAFNDLLFFLRNLIDDNIHDLDKNRCMIINRNNFETYNYLTSVQKWIDITSSLPQEYLAKYFDSPLVLLASILNNTIHLDTDKISKDTKNLLIKFYPEAKIFDTYIDAKTFCIVKIKHFLLDFIRNRNVDGIYVCQRILELIKSNNK